MTLNEKMSIFGYRVVYMNHIPPLFLSLPHQKDIFAHSVMKIRNALDHVAVFRRAKSLLVIEGMISCATLGYHKTQPVLRHVSLPSIFQGNRVILHGLFLCFWTSHINHLLLPSPLLFTKQTISHVVTEEYIGNTLCCFPPAHRAKKA
jgi:hypothetical protein